VCSKALTLERYVSHPNNKCMENVYFIGVDISKKTLDFAVCKDGGIVFAEQCENKKKSVAAMMKRISTLEGFVLCDAVICMEQTGIYNVPLLEYLSTSAVKVWLESSLRIKKSLGIARGKSDKIDASRIAMYAYTFREHIRLWKPAREIITRLKRLNTMRDRLIKTKGQLTVPIAEGEQFFDKKTARLEKKLFRGSIAAMKKDLEEIERQIAEVIDSDTRLKELFRLLTSVDFVGPVIASAMIAATEEFTSFTDPKKFACHCGVAPFEHTSGTSIRGRTRVSRMADKRLKKLFHLAAVASLSKDGELRDYYIRKTESGCHEMSVLNAIRNKIIHRIFAVVNRGSEFIKNYQNALA